MNSHITNPALATNTPAALAAAICGWLSKDHQITRTKSNLYLWRKWAILKCPYMDITVTEKRSASVQGVLPSAQRPTHREEAEPPRLQNGDINISLQPQQLRHRGQQRHFPELTWRNIRGDSLNKSWKQSHFRWRQLDSSETATSSRGFLKVLLSLSLSTAGVRARVGEVKPRGFGQYSPVTSPSACLENSNYRDREQRWIIETW